MSVKSKILKKKLRALFIALIVAIILSLCLHMLWLPYNSVGNAGLWFTAFILTFNYFNRTNIYIVWFRRFHEKDLNKIKFYSLLSTSCMDMCIPITIQDSRFKRSYHGISSKWIFTLLLFSGIIFIPFIVLTLIIVFIFAPIMDIIGSSYATIFATVVMTIAAAIEFAIIYVFREDLGLTGFYALNSHSAIKKADRIMKKIVRRIFNFKGVLIFKSPDEVWHDVVEFILSRVNAVLIDVTEPSENLVWELENSFKAKPLESILITFGLKADAPKKLPENIYKELQRITGRIDLSHLSIFYYPVGEQPPLGLIKLNKLFRTLYNELREEIGRCIGL